MGGCRCTFRKCPNNSANSAGMHFFHYPLKYPERLQQWVKYADTEDFLRLPDSKARNKVVCETHFRDECFMNYKKERLVQFAVPTLVRLANGLVMDYEESDSPTPKVLEPTKSKHLIRPESRPTSSAETSRLSTSEEEFIIETLEDIPAKQNRNEKKRRYSHITIGNCSPSNSKISEQSPPPKILNSSLRYYSAAKSQLSTPKILNVETIHVPRSDGLTSNVDDFCDQLTIEPVEAEEHVVETAGNMFETEGESLMHLQDDEDYSKTTESEKITSSDLAQVVNDYEDQIKKLKDELSAKEAAEKTKTTQVETVSTSRTQASNAPATMTKAQLFNGIKKYLSPSMATLVRMEMFGGPERQWKPDEKLVSVELLQLGESVFKYFRDEWRFRLPPQKDVQKWLSTCESIEEDEDL